jgi:solute carrier family 25 iron transporter 28/37
VCKTLLNTQEDGIGTTRGLLDATKKVYRAAGFMGFFKGMQARMLYQMPACAICWSTYEFFKFLLIKNDKRKPIDDNKMASLHYVLPSTSVSAAKPVLSPVVQPAAASHIKPRELPSMSSAGQFSAVSFNTVHTDKSTTTHLSDFRSSS